MTTDLNSNTYHCNKKNWDANSNNYWIDGLPKLIVQFSAGENLLNFKIRHYHELACICHTLTILTIEYIFRDGES